MRFQLGLDAADEQRFHDGRLREVVLTREMNRFALTLLFGDDTGAVDDPAARSAARAAERATTRPATKAAAGQADNAGALAPGDVRVVPEHLTVIPHSAAAQAAALAPTRQATP